MEGKAQPSGRGDAVGQGAGGAPGARTVGDAPALIARLQHLLSSLGVDDMEPRVVNQLVDFVYRHIADVLQDAEAYSAHAGKAPGQVDTESVMLAIQARSAFTFAAPPDGEEMAGLAATVNAKDLPRFPSARAGLLIPDDKDCLTAQNYSINPSRAG